MKLSFSLRSNPEMVFRFLSEADLFVTVHPVIYNMELIGPNTYRVYEQTQFGFLKYAFTYEAEVIPDTIQKTVQINAVVKKHTTIGMFFHIRPGNHGTIVEERVDIRSPLPIRGFMEKFIRKQHNIMFENIEQEVSRI